MKKGQYKRCPGGADVAASDGSNVLSAAEQAALDCRDSDRAAGPVRRVAASPDGGAGGRGRRRCSRRPAATSPSGAKYRVVFDNAFGLTEGGDLKIAGVRAGADDRASRSPRQKPRKAVVEFEISEPGVGELREDATLRDPPAVADRRVLRGLPAGQLEEAA